MPTGRSKHYWESDPAPDLKRRVHLCFDRFLESYRGWGGFQHPGRTTEDDPIAYLGAAIWSEGDCVYRFALELEREFPGKVHLEFPIATHTRGDYDKSDGSQRIDIVVTDMTSFAEDKETAKRFKALTHDVFIEVKWLYKGPRGSAWDMSMAGRATGVAR